MMNRRKILNSVLLCIVAFLIVINITGCARDTWPLKIAYIDNMNAGNLYIINEDGTEKERLTDHGMARSPNFSSKGDEIIYIYSHVVSPQLHIIDYKGNMIDQFDIAMTMAIHTAWSPDAKKIAVSGLSGSNIVQVYSRNGVLINSKLIDYSGITFYSDDVLIVTTAPQTCELWNFNTGQTISFTVTDNLSIYYMALSPDKKNLLTYYGGPATTYVSNMTLNITESLGGNMSEYAWDHQGNGFYFRGSVAYLNYYDLTTHTYKVITDYPVFMLSVQGVPR